MKPRKQNNFPPEMFGRCYMFVCLRVCMFVCCINNLCLPNKTTFPSIHTLCIYEAQKLKLLKILHQELLLDIKGIGTLPKKCIFDFGPSNINVLSLWKSFSSKGWKFFFGFIIKLCYALIDLLAIHIIFISIRKCLPAKQYNIFFKKGFYKSVRKV